MAYSSPTSPGSGAFTAGLQTNRNTPIQTVKQSVSYVAGGAD